MRSNSLNAIAVKISEAIYLSGLYGSFFGSRNGSAGGGPVGGLASEGVAKLRRVRTNKAGEKRRARPSLAMESDGEKERSTDTASHAAASR